MPRKTVAALDVAAKTAERYAAATAESYQIARAVYDHQDAETQAAIDKVAETLRSHAVAGKVNVKVAGSLLPVKVDDQTLGFGLFQLAVQLVSDLALVGLRLANFRFDPKLCAVCGAKIKAKRGA